MTDQLCCICHAHSYPKDTGHDGRAWARPWPGGVEGGGGRGRGREKGIRMASILIKPCIKARLHTCISAYRGSPVILRLVMLSEVSIGNAAGLLHSAGKEPANGLRPGESSGPSDKESNTGKEALPPQEGGRVPDKLDRSKVRLVRLAKAPGSDHDAGNVPARKKRKEKFRVFSDHNGSLLRRQLGACTCQTNPVCHTMHHACFMHA